jgi:hypothetical protein
MYLGNIKVIIGKTTLDNPQKIKIQRVQTGVRIEKRMLKVLKALAEVHDLTLGDLLEAIVLHAFEGISPFHDDGLKKISMLKEIYGMDYDSRASHHFVEENEEILSGGA